QQRRPTSQRVLAVGRRKNWIARIRTDADVLPPALLLPPSEGCRGRWVERKNAVAPSLRILEDGGSLHTGELHLTENGRCRHVRVEVEVLPPERSDLSGSRPRRDREEVADFTDRSDERRLVKQEPLGLLLLEVNDRVLSGDRVCGPEHLPDVRIEE